MDTKAFEQFLIVHKGLQPITIRGYVTVIKKVLREMGTTTPTHEEVESYVAGLYVSTYSYSHKMNSALALEQWMAFIGNPLRLGRQKKPKRIIQNTLTEAEITKLIFNCKNVREQAIIALLAYSGLRNSELCKLKLKDIDFGSNLVRVREGKGLKDGLMYISSYCTTLLLKYLAAYPRTEEDYIFTTVRNHGRYSGQDLRKLIKVVSKRAKMTKRVYPHLLRHSLAVNMLNRGANIMTIKSQLRHSWIETTMLYVHSLGYGFKTEYERYAPSYI
jgi:integrase/recombinase XerD